MKIQITADLLDGMVLAILEHKDYYGYALTQRMQSAITISESTYDQPYQGRNRRYYQITEAGKEHLQRIRKLWTDYKNSLDGIFYGLGEGEDKDE